MRVALATCAALPALDADELPFAAALRAAGHTVTPAVWTDASVSWADFDVVLPRSCWDYHEHYAGFLGWLDDLDACGARVFNPTPVLRWNVDKRHLVDLARAGAAVTPTRYFPGGASASLDAVLAEEGWDAAVVKPSVSLSAYGTWRTDTARAREHQPAFDERLAAGGVLVQPYLPEIQTAGELSFVFLGGEYSHTVLKHPAAGDFRVQSDHGGRRMLHEPSAALIEEAAVLAACAPGPQLSVRVDGVLVDGRLLLVELELIDPELFFRLQPSAAERLVAALEGAVARET